VPASQEEQTFRGFGIRREVWRIGGRSLELTWPGNVDALLDDPGVQRRFDRDEYMPYWAQPWPASILLAEAVLRGENGLGRAGVEIGCGVGLVSVVASIAGWNMTATDYDPDAVAFAALNAERNGASLAGAQLLDYREPLGSPAYDLVLGSDLLYERKKGEPVARWVASALRPGGYALLSDPNRSAADEFPAHARAAGLVAEPESLETVSPAGLAIRGRIWRVRREEGGVLEGPE
jgi:SAM-dependent methyltransferase